MNDRDTLRSLEKAATALPWNVTTEHVGFLGKNSTLIRDAGGRIVAVVGLTESRENAELIVALRNAAPGLLGIPERAEQAPDLEVAECARCRKRLNNGGIPKFYHSTESDLTDHTYPAKVKCEQCRVEVSCGTTYDSAVTAWNQEQGKWVEQFAPEETAQ